MATSLPPPRCDGLTVGVISDVAWALNTGQLGTMAPVDVLIVAGNAGHGSAERTAVAALADWAGPATVLYVPGPMECHGLPMAQAVARLRQDAQRTRVKIVHRRAITVGGIRFLGATLWPSFDLFGAAHRARLQAQAEAGWADFLMLLGPTGRPVSAAQLREEYQRDLAWLQRQMAMDPQVPKVLITHFLPAARSLPAGGEAWHEALKANPCEGLVKQAAVAVHGHVHATLDYRLDAPLNRGRVLANGGEPIAALAQATPAWAEGLAAGAPWLGWPWVGASAGDTGACNPAFETPLRFRIDAASGNVERLPALGVG